MNTPPKGSPADRARAALRAARAERERERLEGVGAPEDGAAGEGRASSEPSEPGPSGFGSDTVPSRDNDEAAAASESPGGSASSEAASSSEPVEGSEEPGPAGPRPEPSEGSEGARPADAARAALRAARSASAAAGAGSRPVGKGAEAAVKEVARTEGTPSADPAPSAPEPPKSSPAREAGHEADEARAALRAARETAHKEDRTERPRQTTPTPPTRTRARSEGDAPAPSRRGGGPRAASADLADLLQSLGRGAAARTSSAPGADEPAGSAGLHAAPDQLAGAPQRDADSAPAVRPHAADRTADRTATTPRDPAPEPTRHELTRRETTPTSSAAAAAATIRPLPVQDLRRTFSALPQRPAHEGDFAETWWGNAWVRALEEVAADPARLKRGRGYADQGHVEAITVTPGNVLAYVQGSRQRPYRTRIRLRTLDDADWERFLDAAADHPGHLAALLDRELPHGLADLAAGLGVDLLPGPGELQPDCSCPDFGHPCKHAAALCYQTARLLDTDPFVLLLLRGRGEHWLLDTLARRNAHRAARAESAAPPMPGVRATEALGQRVLPPLPAPLPRLVHAGRPPAYPAAPGGPDPLALDQLATDAAARAHAFLITGEDTIGGLTLWQDAVRIAAGQPGSGLTGATRALYAQLAAAADRSTTDLARAVAAWRQGGLDGLTVLDEPWNPPAGPFDQARPALLAAEHPAFRPWRNHLTHPAGHLQLRYGRDGYWYPYEAEPGTDDWWPRGTRDLDPVGALSG